MSKATKRKHVTREVLEGDVTLTDGQSIVRVSLYITNYGPIQVRNQCMHLLQTSRPTLQSLIKGAGHETSTRFTY